METSRWTRRFGGRTLAEDIAEERRLWGADPTFLPIAPPAAWVLQHDSALLRTIGAFYPKGAPIGPKLRARLAANRPVPRQASCHFLRVDHDPRNMYFY